MKDDLCDLCFTSEVSVSHTTPCSKTIGIECGCAKEHSNGSCDDPACEECLAARGEQKEKAHYAAVLYGKDGAVQQLGIPWRYNLLRIPQPTVSTAMNEKSEMPRLPIEREFRLVGVGTRVLFYEEV